MRLDSIEADYNFFLFSHAWFHSRRGFHLFVIKMMVIEFGRHWKEFYWVLPSFLQPKRVHVEEPLHFFFQIREIEKDKKKKMQRQFSSKFLPFSVFSDFLPLPPQPPPPSVLWKKKEGKKLKPDQLTRDRISKRKNTPKKKNKTKRKRKRNGVFESPIRSRSRKEESGHASARFRSKVRHDTRKKSPKKKE